jgi:HK97 gp10 family phage protein
VAAVVTTIPALVAELQAAAAMAPSKAARGCTKAAFDTQAHARSLVPVDTGNLKNSITVAAYGTDGPYAEVGPEAVYGGYVEHGTVNMAAQPYLAPALDLVAPGFEQAMTDSLMLR